MTAHSVEVALSIYQRHMIPWTAVGIILALISYRIYGLFADPLRNVPGPVLARFTRLWELINIHHGHFEQVTIDLHRKFGSVIRISPNRYSFNTPAACKIIYGSGSQFVKHRWYRVYGHPDDAQADIFSTINPEQHASARRKIASLYTLTWVLGYETIVNDSISSLGAALSHLSSSNRPIDLPTWLQFFAFDVITAITCGRSLCLLTLGSDPTAILAATHSSLTYSSHVSIYPSLHPWITALGPYVRLPNPNQAIAEFVSRRLEEHERERERDTLQKNSKSSPTSGTHRDGDGGMTTETNFLSQLSARNVRGADAFRTVFANIAAGADSTGLTLAAAVYFLFRGENAGCLAKLREELAKLRIERGNTEGENAKMENTMGENAKKEDKMAFSPMAFARARECAYLNAVIKEALRLHPAVGLMLPRVVPRGGAELEGRFFPAGTVVGVNAWALHRDATVFGAEVDEFRPERWLGPAEEVAAMERTLFSFGAGARACIGRNIVTLEITKVLPFLVENFDFRMLDCEWKTQNVFFVKNNFQVQVLRREG